jgi:hypothetical protein
VRLIEIQEYQAGGLRTGKGKSFNAEGAKEDAKAAEGAVAAAYTFSITGSFEP